MIRPRPLSIALLSCLLAGPALAQSNIWKWRDAQGGYHVSDQPPPAGVPAASIVARPSGQTIEVLPTEAPASAASAGDGTDSALEARRRKLQADKKAAEAARQQAQKAQDDARRADTCQRAQGDLKMLESGARVARPNPATGEREFLDDQGRINEINRARAAVNDNCR